MHIKRTREAALAALFVVLAVPGAASAATTLQPGAYMETVKGWPAYPKGATVPSDTLTGDSIQLSGYGLGYDTTQHTQEQRTAVMGFDDAETYTSPARSTGATRAVRSSTSARARRSASSRACARRAASAWRRRGSGSRW